MLNANGAGPVGSGPCQSIPYWRLSFFYFFYFTVLGSLLPYWPLYLKDLGFDAKAIGYLSGIIMATKIVAPNIWGWLADRSGQHIRIIRTGAFLGLCIFGGVLVSDRFWWLALIVAGYSFFWNAILSQFDVVTLGHLGKQYQRYSQIRLWGSLGFIAAVLVLGAVFDLIVISWLPWIVLGCLLALWLSSLVVKDADPEHQQQADHRSFVKTLKQPTVIAFIVTCFLLQVSHGPYYTFFSVYLEQLQYDRTAIGLLWSLGVLAEVLLFVVMHKLLSRFSLREIMLASLLLAVLRWLLIAFVAEQLWVLLFAQCLHAATFGSFHAFAVEFIRRTFRHGSKGQGMALYSAASFGAGGAVGAVCSGLVWEFSPQIAFSAAAVSCLIALLVSAIWVKPEQMA
jgi:PPP family 3-phenylpropionic acid transporter